MLYEIKKNSALISFLQEREITLPVQLNVILKALKNYIISTKSFDPSNRSIILCNQRLENVFGCKSLHVNQVKNIIMRFLTLPLSPPLPEVSNKTACTRIRYRFPKEFEGILPGASTQKDPVYLREAIEIISGYIIRNKEGLIDARNEFYS